MTLLIEDKRFYVYVYLDPRKSGKYKYGIYRFNSEPFYVGKGHNYRKFDHIYDAKNTKYNNPKLNKIRKIKSLGLSPSIVEVSFMLNEVKANDIECHLISLIGRKDLKKGPLLNLTDGGEGNSGIIRSLEYREKMSKIHKNKIVSEETREKIRKLKKGKRHSDITKNKIREHHKGRKRLPETIKKMSQSMKDYFKKNPEMSISIGNFHRNKKLSEETKQKIREKRKSQIMRPVSDETILKMSESAKSRQPFSEETKIRMSVSAKLRKPVSKETRMKMSLSQKERRRNAKCI